MPSPSSDADAVCRLSSRCRQPVDRQPSHPIHGRSLDPNVFISQWDTTSAPSHHPDTLLVSEIFIISIFTIITSCRRLQTALPSLAERSNPSPPEGVGVERRTTPCYPTVMDTAHTFAQSIIPAIG
jgi:hypothetical protein